MTDAEFFASQIRDVYGVAAPIPDAAPHEYVPTTDDVRQAWRQQLRQPADLDRWLAAHDRAVRDAALTEAEATIKAVIAGSVRDAALMALRHLREGTPNE